MSDVLIGGLLSFSIITTTKYFLTLESWMAGWLYRLVALILGAMYLLVAGDIAEDWILAFPIVGAFILLERLDDYLIVKGDEARTNVLRPRR